jgi:hypothetical protein
MSKKAKTTKQTPTLTKTQSKKFLNQLESIRANPKYEFKTRKSAFSVNANQVEGVKQVASLVNSALPASSTKDAVASFLESEVKYFQKVSKLNQQRNVQMQKLSTTIFGPGGQPIIPYAPLPMSDMVFVGWDKEGKEVYYNTDDGYYYTRDKAGGNTFTRFNGDYLDSDGTSHDAKKEAENCDFWQSLYRFFGFDKDKLKFPDVFINNLDLKYKNKVRPDNDWFDL